MKVKLNTAAKMVVKFIKAGIVPMVHGSPGSGKSQMMYQIAEEYGLKLIDLRLSQCDPTDLCGYPSIDTKLNKAGYVPMDTFPLEGDPVPEGCNGWLLFFDEINSAPKAVQASAYKILLDRKIGQTHLHKNCAIVAAGNLETDGAIVEEMSTALQSRMAHIELEVDVDQWVLWAQKAGIHHMVTSYIQFKPGMLNTFKADHTDKTYACPRTWQFADKVLKVTEDDPTIRIPMLSGTLSEGVARELMTFIKIYDSLPKPAQIRAAPESVPVPTEPSVLYAITGAVAHNATEDTIEQYLKYLNRLPKEFQVITLREIVRRNKSMMGTPAIQKWIGTSAVELF